MVQAQEVEVGRPSTQGKGSGSRKRSSSCGGRGCCLGGQKLVVAQRLRGSYSGSGGRRRAGDSRVGSQGGGHCHQSLDISSERAWLSSYHDLALWEDDGGASEGEGRGLRWDLAVCHSASTHGNPSAFASAMRRCERAFSPPSATSAVPPSRSVACRASLSYDPFRASKTLGSATATS